MHYNEPSDFYSQSEQVRAARWAQVMNQLADMLAMVKPKPAALISQPLTLHVSPAVEFSNTQITQAVENKSVIDNKFEETKAIGPASNVSLRERIQQEIVRPLQQAISRNNADLVAYYLGDQIFSSHQQAGNTIFEYYEMVYQHASQRRVVKALIRLVEWSMRQFFFRRLFGFELTTNDNYPFLTNPSRAWTAWSEDLDRTRMQMEEDPLSAAPQQLLAEYNSLLTTYGAGEYNGEQGYNRAQLTTQLQQLESIKDVFAFSNYVMTQPAALRLFLKCTTISFIKQTYRLSFIFYVKPTGSLEDSLQEWRETLLRDLLRLTASSANTQEIILYVDEKHLPSQQADDPDSHWQQYQSDIQSNQKVPLSWVRKLLEEKCIPDNPAWSSVFTPSFVQYYDLFLQRLEEEDALIRHFNTHQETTYDAYLPVLERNKEKVRALGQQYEMPPETTALILQQVAYFSADVEFFKDQGSGRLPLHYAMQTWSESVDRNNAVILYLLARSSKFNCEDDKGYTPLSLIKLQPEELPKEWLVTAAQNLLVITQQSAAAKRVLQKRIKKASTWLSWEGLKCAVSSSVHDAYWGRVAATLISLLKVVQHTQMGTQAIAHDQNIVQCLLQDQFNTINALPWKGPKKSAQSTQSLLQQWWSWWRAPRPGISIAAPDQAHYQALEVEEEGGESNKLHPIPLSNLKPAQSDVPPTNATPLLSAPGTSYSSIN